MNCAHITGLPLRSFLTPAPPPQLAQFTRRYEESGSDSDIELPELLPLDAVPKPEPEPLVAVAAAAPARRSGRARPSGANGAS